MTTAKEGRPTKFTPENKEKLLIAIRKGAPYEIACNYAGICYVTFMNWRNKANIDKIPEYVEFFRDLKEAEGQIALVWLDKIDKAMNEGAWQAAAWKLERRHYKHFSSQAGMIEMNQRLDQLEKGSVPHEVKDEVGNDKENHEG